MKFNTKNISFSYSDLKRKVKIPQSLDKNLAELIGIIIGDGNIYMKNNRYEVHITGDLREDRLYHKKHIVKLIKKIFNIEPKIIEKNNFRRLRIKSKVIVSFLTNVLRLSNGKKTPYVPHYISDSNFKIIKHFLRGLADTDFTIKFKTRYGKKNYYPIIIGNFNNKKFVESLKVLLEKINFHTHMEHRKKYDKIRNKRYESWTINLVGKKNFKRWMENIGFSNDRHLVRYRVWKKIGFCPPYTNISKGTKLLENN